MSGFLGAQVAALLRVIAGGLVLALFSIIFYVAWDFIRDPVRLELIDMSAEQARSIDAALEKIGGDSQKIEARLEQLTRYQPDSSEIVRGGYELRFRALDATPIYFQVGGLRVPADDVVKEVRGWLDRPSRRARIRLVACDGGVQLAVETDIERVLARCYPQAGADIGAMAAQAAEEVYRRFDPFVLAAHLVVADKPDLASAELSAALKVNDGGCSAADFTNIERAIRLLAILAAADEKFEQAVSSFDCLIARQKEPDAADYYNRGNALAAWGEEQAEAATAEASEKFALAVRSYADATKKNRKHKWAFNNWGNALLGWGDVLAGQAPEAAAAKYEEAGAQYDAATRIDPDFAIAFYNWGIALASWGDVLAAQAPEAAAAKYEEAGAKFDAATRIDPKYAKAFYNWGTALGRWGDLLAGQAPEAAAAKYEEAGAKFDAATRIDPSHAKAFNNWGNALYSWGNLLSGRVPEAAAAKYEEAGAKYDAATRIDPNDAVAFYNWGIALSSWGDVLAGQAPEAAAAKYEEAGAKYDAATRIDPNDAVAFYNWGVTLYRWGRLLYGRAPAAAAAKFQEAAAKYGRAADLDPSDATARYRAGLMQVNSGQIDLACESMLKAKSAFRQAGNTSEEIEVDEFLADNCSPQAAGELQARLHGGDRETLDALLMALRNRADEERVFLAAGRNE